MTGKRRKFEREMDEELRGHIAAETEENIRRGMSREEARRRALAEFGGVEAVKEEARAMRWGVWLETLVQDLRYAARMLRKAPGFTAVAVLTLALGIGANTAIFSVVNAILLRPLPFPDPGQIVSVSENDDDGTTLNTGFATYADWRDRNQSFQELGIIAFWGATLTGAGEPVRLDGVRVTSSFFRALGVAPRLGPGFTPEDDRPGAHQKVILSHQLWQQRFSADPGVIGRLITVNGAPHEVAGVMPPNYRPVAEQYFYHRPEIWRVLGYDVTQAWACRTCRHLKTVGRLKPGVTREDASAEASALLEAMRTEHPTNYLSLGARVESLDELVTGGVRPALLLLLGAVGLVLLIACANVAGLQLVRATGRQREMAVRAALGAGRMRLVRQVLTESLVLALAGGLAGLLLAEWGVAVLLQLAPADLPRLEEVHVDPAVQGFTLLLSVFTGLLFGLAPVQQSVRVSPAVSLAEGTRGATSGKRPRRTQNSLVVANFALALMLLTSAGLLLRSFTALLEVRPGFDPGGMLTMHVTTLGPKYAEDPAVRSFFDELERRLLALPGVESVAVTTQLPLGGNSDNWGIHNEENPAANPAEAPYAVRYVINPAYLRTMRIPLLAGRNFGVHDAPDAPAVVLVSDTMRRTLWPGRNPLGKRIQIGGGPTNPWRTVVGVVGDVRHHSLDETPGMQVYTPFAQQTNSYVELAVRTAGDPGALVETARRTVWSLDPDLPISRAAPYTEVIGGTMAERRFTLLVVMVFAGLAMVLAAVGIYGVISYAVARRTQEIGIRKALGATPESLLRMVIGQGIALAACGVALGVLGALAATRWMAGQLYAVETYDPITYAGVAVLLCAVALPACWIPARRAMRVDPMVALRHE